MIYIRKNNGPRIDSWWFSALVLVQDECCPFKKTLCFLWYKTSVITFERLPDKPFCFNLKRRPSCQTLSNALDISRKTPVVSRPSSSGWWRSWVIHNSWLMHESLDWLWEINSFSEKNSSILLKISHSIILPQTATRLDDSFQLAVD